MDQGRLVELGSHNDLLARGGVYANLVKLQFEGQPVSSGVIP
jgi:ABC-type multidrug transport system fused ATPase/permease subunit